MVSKKIIINLDIHTLNYWSIYFHIKLILVNDVPLCRKQLDVSCEQLQSMRIKKNQDLGCNQRITASCFALLYACSLCAFILFICKQSCIDLVICYINFINFITWEWTSNMISKIIKQLRVYNDSMALILICNCALNLHDSPPTRALTRSNSQYNIAK